MKLHSPRILAAAIAALALSNQASAADIFSDNMSTGANWTILQTPDSSAQFGYDYSQKGLPPAPRGSDTIGLKLEANNNNPPGNESIFAFNGNALYTGQYTLRADVWINWALVNGTTGTGSTEYAGVSIGHSGSVSNLSGASFQFDGDGDVHPSDYVLSKNTANQVAFDKSVFAQAFPAINVATAVPLQGQTGSTFAGAGGFQWMTINVEVDTTAIGPAGINNNLGVARFTIQSAASHNTALIGLIDNSNGGPVVPMSGGIALSLMDIFPSVTTNPAFSFAIFDNVQVLQGLVPIPEPTSIQLVLFGCICFGISVHRRRLAYRAIPVACLLITALAASTSSASILFGPDFTSYAAANLGSPSGLPTPAGGLTLLAGDPNTLLIGGNANTPSGAIYSIGLTRDAGNHITGFSGTTALYASAPYIDGGLAYGPGNVLFYTRYNVHELGQIKPLSASTDRFDAITGFGAPGNSVGSLAFVPNGFGSPGTLKISTFQQGQFGTLPLTADGTGTYNLGAAVLDATLGGGPEGIAYVAAGSQGFNANSILVAEYNNGTIASYNVDANDNPVLASRREFLTGLTGAEGAFIDPLTGDFLFSTFMAGSEVFVVQDFTGTPEPSSAMIWLGLTFAGTTTGAGRRRTKYRGLMSTHHRRASAPTSKLIASAP